MRTKERLRKIEMVLGARGEDNKDLSNWIMVLYEDDNQEEMLKEYINKYGEEPHAVIEIEGKRPGKNDTKCYNEKMASDKELKGE